MEVWYPLGHGDKKLFSEPVLEEIGARHNKIVAQIILRWHLQKGNFVFPKSTNPQHIRENMNIYDFALSEDEMRKIDIMGKNKSYFNWPEWFERFMYKFSDKVSLGDKD